MTWFFKGTVFCATILLLGFSLEVLGYTLFMCQLDCKDEPDDHLCGQYSYKADDRARTNVTRYKWLRNECERKCFSKGDYKRVADMEVCTKNGQTQMAYICDEHDHPTTFQRCMRNESLYDK